MSSPVPEELSREKSEPIRTLVSRLRMSLADEIYETPRTDPQLEASKSIEEIRTFIIWSIFNLLFIPFGIACCYFSYQVDQFKKQNRYELALKWSRRTFVINIMGTLIMVGLIITIYMLHYDYEQRNNVPDTNGTRTTGSYIAWQPGR